MRAVITGGNGFVGRHLAAHLRACGDTVTILDRDEHLDVRDRASTHELIAAATPEVVYHLAAFTHVGDSWADPSEVVRVNVEGTMNVLDASRAAGASRVLVVGSAEEYGKVSPDEVPLSESTPLRPTTPYGASKAAAGLFAVQAWLAHGLETVRVRPFNHTGPGQAPIFLAPALAQRILDAIAAGHDAIPIGNLEPVRELLDVRDVVRAYRLLMERGVPGEAYNVATGHGHSVREIAETLLALAERPLRLEVDPALVRPVEVARLVGDPSKLERATGWQPEHALTSTLRAVFDDAQARHTR